MAETFIPPRAPDQSSRKRTEFRTLEASFGDGYSQASPDGLNSVRDIWTLSWSSLDETEKDAVEDFFKARGTHDPFDWMAPGASAAQRWKIVGGFDTRSRGGDYVISTVFREDFTL